MCNLGQRHEKPVIRVGCFSSAKRAKAANLYIEVEKKARLSIGRIVVNLSGEILL